MSPKLMTNAEENEIYGRDLKLRAIDGSLDLDVKGDGDLKLTDGLAELTLNVVTLLLNTVYNPVTGEGELPFHPDFGSTFKYLTLNPIPDEEFIEIMQVEVINSIMKYYSNIITSIEFSNTYATTSGELYFEIILTIISGGTATLGVTV